MAVDAASLHAALRPAWWRRRSSGRSAVVRRRPPPKGLGDAEPFLGHCSYQGPRCSKSSAHRIIDTDTLHVESATAAQSAAVFGLRALATNFYRVRRGQMSSRWGEIARPGHNLIQ